MDRPGKKQLEKQEVERIAKEMEEQRLAAKAELEKTTKPEQDFEEKTGKTV